MQSYRTAGMIFQVLLFSAALYIIIGILKEKYGKIRTVPAVISAAVFSVSDIILAGSFEKASAGLILFLILFFGTVSDIKERNVSDCISVCILILSFPEINDAAELALKISGALFVFIPQFALAVLRPGTYGGADIKITSALTFFLGPVKGIPAFVLGLASGIAGMLIQKKALHGKTGAKAPLIPYFSVSALIFFIFGMIFE